MVYMCAQSLGMSACCEQLNTSVDFTQDDAMNTDLIRCALVPCISSKESTAWTWNLKGKSINLVISLRRAVHAGHLGVVSVLDLHGNVIQAYTSTGSCSFSCHAPLNTKGPPTHLIGEGRGPYCRWLDGLIVPSPALAGCKHPDPGMSWRGSTHPRLAAAPSRAEATCWLRSLCPTGIGIGIGYMRPSSRVGERP